MGAGGDRQATWLGARMESVKRGNDDSRTILTPHPTGTE